MIIYLNKTRLLLSILFLLALNACNCITGEGDVISEERQVSAFTKIKLSAATKVILRQDSVFHLKIDGQANILDLLKTEVRSKTLSIDFGFRCVRDAKDVTIYLSMPRLEGIDVSGSGKVICLRKFRTQDLELDISGSGEIIIDLSAREIESGVNGSGEIEITGTTKKHTIDINGSGQVYAYDLRSSDTRVKISGSGDAKVFAVGSLNASVLGSGSVYYKGNPDVRTKINGSGKVQKIN